jgi:hypothetical protein
MTVPVILNSLRDSCKRDPRRPPSRPREHANFRELLLYRDSDRRRFDRALVRWHALLCLEVGTLSPADAQLALAALNALGDGEALPAATALRELLSANGQGDAAEALDHWLEQTPAG